MKRCLIAFLFVLGFTSLGFAGLIPLTDSPAAPLAVRLADATPTGVAVDLAVSGLQAELLEGDAAGYAALSWDNGGVEGAIGDPCLPVRRMLLAIPWGASVQPRVETQRWVEHDLNALTGATALAPVQPPLEKIEGATVPFTRNAAAYARRGYGDTPVVEVEDIVTVRGQQLALVTVRPLQYDPAAGTVRIAEQLRVRFDFAGGDLNATAAMRARYQDRRWAGLIDETVINPVTDDLDELPTSLGYLVITVPGDDVAAELQPYLDWKAAQGYEVSVASTADIGSSTSEIKSYIQNAYDSWDSPPSFVLLVGDTPEIPHWVGSGQGNPNTDLNYVQLAGADYFADAGIGRFSFSSTDELANMISKTMQYEKVQWFQGDDWVTHQVFMASVDNYQISEGTHNFVLNNYLIPNNFTADLLYQVTYGATTQDVTDSFNAGTNLGTYSGHGANTYWADGPEFHQGDVEALVNTVYPFVQSYACITGSYHLDECFAETWIRTENGAFAMMASSVNSYWDEDDVMEKKVYEAFFDNQTPGDPHNITWINGMVDYGKLKLYEHYGNTGMVRRYFEMYNIMGDGSVDLWTTVPQTVTVNHPAAFFLGMTEIEVTVPNAPAGWARVCVMSAAQPEIIVSGYTNASGVASLTLPEAPTLPGELKIVVTGHNIDPYEATIPLTASEGPYVVFDSVEINDADGWNPNGVLDYGEMALLSVTVQNVGVDASGDPTTVTLQGVGSEIGFVDNVESTGSIPAEGFVTLTDAFEIWAAPILADAVFSVPVQIADSWDLWESSMPISVSAAHLVADGVSFDDSDGGNGNNWLDPGENATVTITLTNDGSSPLENGEVLLGGDDEYVSIVTDNVETFTVLEPGQSVQLSWGIMASADCPQDYNTWLQSSVLADHGYVGGPAFAITVGDVLFAPSGPDGYGYLAYDPNDGLEAIPFDWVEISPMQGGFGTSTGITSDDMVETFDLPFTFTYYGEDYSQISIDSNGMLSMGMTNSYDYSNSQIPNSDGPGAMIAPFWEDLNPSRPGCDGIYYWHDQVNHRFVVEWSVIDQFSPSGTFETFQVLLYDPMFYPTSTGDGIIQFQYLDISDEIATSATVGIENPAETDGLQLVYDGSWDEHLTPIESGMSITFVAGSTDLLPRPENLTAELGAGGAVDLAWSFPGRYSFEQLTAPQQPQPGDKPDVVRDEDRAQVADWRDYGVPQSELDEFLNFRVYRDNVMIGEPADPSFADQLPEHGDYSYTVTALHDEGESLPSNAATVTWDALVSLMITPDNNFVGAGGGTLTYAAHLVAGNPNPFPGADYWTMVTLPNGNTVGPVFQASFTLPAMADITVPVISQYVPAAAPSGMYQHHSYVGLYPGFVGATDSFEFIKGGNSPAGTVDLSQWTCSGWTLGADQTVAAVEAPLPDQFEVGAAYPNPFNPTVTVSVALPEAGRLDVVLVNVLGRQVAARTLEAGAGYHSVTLDGSALSSGLYLLSVRGHGETVQQKVMLLK